MHYARTGAILLRVKDEDQEKEKIWANLCRENAWVCRICGAVPELRVQFKDDLCDDCRKLARNE